jgi:transcription elongation factor Elf1
VSRLPFTCPVCEHEAAAAPSLAMLHGHNAGHGSCPKCNTFLALSIRPGGQTMQATRWTDRAWKRNSGLDHTSREVALWRSDVLLARLSHHDHLPLWAIRYALKQGPYVLTFLNALTFVTGSAHAFREAAVYQRDLARRRRLDAPYYERRAALLDEYALKGHTGVPA